MVFNYDLKEIHSIAEKIYHCAGDKKVWAIHGEMGAGKTTFIHALCENLGVVSSIGSPTYSIINEYKSSHAGIIYHIDLYRLKDEEEAIQAGVEDVIESGNVCFIEWPDRAPGLLPYNCFHIAIEMVDEDKRRLSVIQH